MDRQQMQRLDQLPSYEHVQAGNHTTSSYCEVTN
jgi:hypothetical protein